MRCPIDENLSENVRDYKLKTYYEGNITVHLHNDPDTPPSAPQRRERWKKVRTIGQGGQSEVVLETCIDGGRHYTERAVKKIRLQGGDLKRRYESELGAIVKFSHDRYSKHFVKLLGWFASSTKLYMAMEYFPAGDLYSYVRKHQGLPEDDCRQIACQLLSAIAAMHTEGFAHRDIKPQNILVHSHPQPDEKGLWWVKLGDFGISKRISGSPNITTSSVGTMLYMAPELFNVNCSDIPSSDYQEADLWSLGITIFFILTNAVPFQTPASTIQFAQNSGEPFPRAFLDHYEVTKEGQAFVRETLTPEPGKRLNSFMAMDHAWIHPLFPDAPASGTRSRYVSGFLNYDEVADGHRPSTISSRRSSIDDDCVAKSLTTEISTLSSQPVTQVQSDEGHSASDSPKEQSRPLGSAENVTVDETTSDTHNGTHNGPFPICTSGTPSNAGRLHNAVILGRVRDIETLIDQGASPDALHDGQSPLHTSAGRGDVEVTRFLCDRSVDIEAEDQYGKTALMIAVSLRDLSLIKLLLEKGADIEAKDNDGYTVLIEAASFRDSAVIKLLLEHGAYIEAKDNHGMTALAVAVAEGNCIVIELLLEKGADIEARDDDGNTALHIAAGYGNCTVITLLLGKGVDIEARDNDGDTALHVAAAHGKYPAVELLLEKGANIEAKDNDGETTLHLAAVCGQCAVIELLLEKGANIEAKDNNGETAFLTAVAFAQCTVIELLFKKGANIDVKNNNGLMAFSIAVHLKEPAVVKLLRSLLWTRKKMKTRRF